MFEKEAEEYRKEKLEERKDKFVFELPEVYVADIKQAYQQGAEFGYNKANEWHYMKDVNCYEDLPQNKDVYYAYVVNVGAYDKPTIERRLGCFAEFEYDVMAYHVIAWKEIVLPELQEWR